MESIREGRALLEQYLKFAVTHLTPNPPTEKPEMEQLLQKFAVRFLFPQLAAEEQEMLSSLMWLRRALILGIQAKGHIKNETDRVRHEELLQKIIPQFEGIRERIQTSSFFFSLTEFQQSYLEDEIFQIPQAS